MAGPQSWNDAEPLVPERPDAAEEDCATRVMLTKAACGEGSVVPTGSVAAGVLLQGAPPHWVPHTGATLPLADTAATTPVHGGADSPSPLAHAAAVPVAA